MAPRTLAGPGSACTRTPKWGRASGAEEEKQTSVAGAQVPQEDVGEILWVLPELYTQCNGETNEELEMRRG